MDKSGDIAGLTDFPLDMNPPIVPDYLDEDVILKPRLDNIFAEVEACLPSIDFETSDLSSEEDVPIFHRSLKTPTSDDDDRYLDGSISPSDSIFGKGSDKEDIDSSEKTKASENSSWAMLSEFSGTKSSQFTRPVSAKDYENKRQKSPKRPKSAKVMHISEEKPEFRPEPLKNTWTRSVQEQGDNKSKEFDVVLATPPQSPNIGDNKLEPPELSPKENEKEGIVGDELTKTLPPRQILKDNEHSEKSKSVVSQYFSTTPELSLEAVDLDGILVGIVSGTKLPPEYPEQGEPEEQSLIQKIAQMSLSNQTVKEVDPDTGAIKSRYIEAKEIKTAQNVAVMKNVNKNKTSAMGTSTTDLSNLPRASLPSPMPLAPEKRDTVFIDLRNFEKKTEEKQHKFHSVQRILGIGETIETVESSDDSDEETGLMWHEQRRVIKESLSKTGTFPKTLNIHKKSVSKMTSSPAPHTQAQRLAGHLPPKKSAVKPNEIIIAKGQLEILEKDDQSVPTEGEATTSVEDRKKTLTKEEQEREEAMKKVEAVKKMREKREAQRQSKIRLGQRLEALRPTLSTSGKQPSAEATPTIFNVEASYEPAPLTLPTEVKTDREFLLLTVNLSGNGEVTVHRSSTNRSVDSGMGLSATYTTVLTWLLSRVPDKFDFLKDSPPAPMICEAPFHVVGMQQLYLDGQLALYVAVTPVFDPGMDKRTGRKTKQKRDEMKDSTPFHQMVSRYLSTNKLHTVCAWLEDLVSMEVSGNKKEDDRENGFVYKPPLPNISQKPLSTFVQVNPDPQAVSKVFGLDVGFFWQTLEVDDGEKDHCLKDEGVDYETQNTMSLIYKNIYRDPRAVMGILNRVLQEGFDLAGVRLLYPTPELLKCGSAPAVLPSFNSNLENQSPLEIVNSVGPILALCIRGTFARSLWLDAIGPSDPTLARRTDPMSLCALYGGESRDECFLFCPRNSTRVSAELARWFGGRVPASGVIDIGHASKHSNNQSGASNSGKKSKKLLSEGKSQDIPKCKPPASLTATARGELLLVISPLVPTKCQGLLLATAQRRGYQLRGIRRLRMNAKRAHVLGISASRIPVFSASGSTPASPLASTEPVPSFDFSEKSGLSAVAPNPCTVLLLSKENASHGAASLIEAFMVQLSLTNVLGSIQKTMLSELTSGHLFHVVCFSEVLQVSLGGDFSKTPEAELATTPGYIEPQLYTNPEVEEIVVLTLTGHAFMKNFGLFLGKLQNLVPYSRSVAKLSVHEGFELLGIKWLPGLSTQHAKELTPFEVGDKNWKPSIQMLTSEPAVIIVIRGIDAFKRVEVIVNQKAVTTAGQKPPPLDRIMSPTPELAYRQARLFFWDHELFSDNEVRSLMPYIPPNKSPRAEEGMQRKRMGKVYNKQDLGPGYLEEHIMLTMQRGPRPLTAMLVVKPDVVQKKLGKLLRRVTQEGFKVVALRLELLSRDQATFVIPESDREDEMMESLHLDYLTQSCCLLLVLQRENAVKKLKDILGPDDPKEAKNLGNFLWRSVFGSDPVANGLHGSSNYNMAVLEQKMFFPQGLCCKENEDLTSEGIWCPGEDVIINSKESREIVFTSKANSDMDSAPATVKSSGTTAPRVLPVSSLTQTNCLVFLPTLLDSEGRSKRYPYVEILDHLLQEGFELVGSRMIWFTEQQAQDYLHLIDAGSFQMVPYLTSGPSLILAVQRDNAVVAFDEYLGSFYDKESIYSKYNKLITRPRDIKKANEFLTFFFDKLIPESHAKIVEKS